VLLVERESFPRQKVCGCCLSPLALSELDKLNLTASGQRLASAAANGRLPLDTVQLIAAGRVASLRLPPGAVQSRESLDPAIVQAAIDAGAAWLPQTRVTSCHPTATGVNVHVTPAGHDEQNFSCDRLVLAGGLADAVRTETPSGSRPADRRRSPNNRIGVGATLPSTSGSLPAGLLAMAVGPSGYCGLVRLEDGRIDLAAALVPAAVATAGTPAIAVSDLLEKAGGQRLHLVERADVEAALFRATPSLTHRTPIVDPTSDRIFRAGDATGYVEPFTGEGIGWALHAARLLAESVLSPTGQLRPPAEAAARYRQRHRLGLRGRHRRCRLVALALRSPFFVSTAVRSASWFPAAASYVAHCCTGNAAELLLGRTAGLR